MDPAQVEEAAACGLCGEPLIDGATGSMEPRGGYHVGCIRKARREHQDGTHGGPEEYRGARRRRRRS